MATTVKRRVAARRNVRKATAASAAKRRGKVQVKTRARNLAKSAVRRTTKVKRKTSVKPKGPLARLAARTRKVLGIKKTTAATRRARAARTRRARAAEAQALIDLPPSMPM